MNRTTYLEAMGVQCWERRNQPASGLSSSETPSGSTESVEDAIPNMDWDALRACVSNCDHCSLKASRTQTVFGSGNPEASWMLIGEAPGKDEDLQGEPFVGQAGQLLTEMLRAVNLSRKEAFIANILKCRPPGNRDPLPDEVDRCSVYLERQISLVKPDIILAVGRIAAQNLLKTDNPLSQLRGKVHHYGVSRIPVVVIYHPAYLLRSLREKRKAWDDLQLAMNARQENG